MSCGVELEHRARTAACRWASAFRSKCLALTNASSCGFEEAGELDVYEIEDPAYAEP
jgi:hypothetical protein